MSGEFDRIRQIIDRLGPAASAGIGDDCAILPDGTGKIVASTDLSVEGVHFRTDWLTLEEIGWRAAAGALSDLAAEGAETIGLVASVGVPAGAADDAVLQLMSGAGEAVREAGGVVLGGDLSRSPHWIIDITVLGRAERPVSRAGARAGDRIWVSGALGGARAALRAWQRGEGPTPAARAAFAHPVPRIVLGQKLASAGATAMIDLSDGLAGDAPHIAAASRQRLVIQLERVPLHPAVPDASRREGQVPVVFGALGGEDYELLVTMPETVDPAFMSRLSDETGVPLTQVGTVQDGEGVSLLLGDDPQQLGGFDHFA